MGFVCGSNVVLKSESKRRWSFQAPALNLLKNPNLKTTSGIVQLCKHGKRRLCYVNGGDIKEEEEEGMELSVVGGEFRTEMMMPCTSRT